MLGFFFGALNQAALAQSPTPLRVDPALLGLPPARKPETPFPAQDAAPPAGVPPNEESRERKSGLPSRDLDEDPMRAGKVERESTHPDAGEGTKPGALPPVEAPGAPEGEVPERGTVSPQDGGRIRDAAETMPESAILAKPAEIGVPDSTMTPAKASDPESAPGNARAGAMSAGRAREGEEENERGSRPAGGKIRDAGDLPQPRSERSRVPRAAEPAYPEEARRIGILRVDPRLLGLPAAVMAPETETKPEAETAAISNAPAFHDETFEGKIFSGEFVDDLPPPKLKLSKTLGPEAESGSGDERPIFLIADRVDGDGDNEMNAYGAAELRKPGLVVKADRLTYWPVEDEIEGEGNARLERAQDVVSGPKMRMKLEDKVGFFEKPSFFVKPQPKKMNTFWMRQPTDDDDASGFSPPLMVDFKRMNSRAIARTYSDIRGDADQLELKGENHYDLTNARFSTCSPENYDWYLKADELKLDLDKEEGRGRGATLYFKDIPLFYSPILPFSLSNARKSGFLAPSFGA
ncbi:MAG: hypothetical protein LBJ76_00870, partial [Candidatus Accumulibacter sp.]|nr:hypothetical protein [Accumulibacter sp.]